MDETKFLNTLSYLINSKGACRDEPGLVALRVLVLSSLLSTEAKSSAERVKSGWEMLSDNEKNSLLQLFRNESEAALTLVRIVSILLDLLMRSKRLL